MAINNYIAQCQGFHLINAQTLNNSHLLTLHNI